jgi:exopolysaccharide biosynthesis operon protein EpsL
LIGATPLPSWALFNDVLDLWVTENYTHDSNVFRISDRLGPGLIGANGLSDTFYTTHLGAAVSVPVSQQRFEASYDWFRARYDRFSDLDFDGHLAYARWKWAYEQKATGILAYNESENLSSFANIQGRDKDVVRARQGQATGAWLLTPRWRANAGVSELETRHSSQLRNVNDIRSRVGDIGLSYLTPADNSVGSVFRVEDGESPHDVTINGIAFNNAYRQLGFGALVAWAFNPHSRLDARADWIRRQYEKFTSRNFDGIAYRAVYKWTPTPKTTVDASVFRDIGPAEDVTTSFVLVRGAYIRPKWDITPKLAIQGNLEYNVWDYRGDPLLAQNFTHHLRLYGAALSWQPFEKILLHAGVNRERRTSTLAFGDYDADVYFVEGRVGF